MGTASRIGRASPALIVAVMALVALLGGSALAVGERSLPDRWKLPEPFHAVGKASEPRFGDGGQGDCVWGNPASQSISVEGLNPAAFYRDPIGTVHMAGVVVPAAAPDGDGSCGGSDGFEDSVIFVLPEGYRPENVELAQSGLQLTLVVPDDGAIVDGSEVPPGAVVAAGGFGLTILDGISFRAAGPETRSIDVRGPVEVESLKQLRSLAR